MSQKTIVLLFALGAVIAVRGTADDSGYRLPRDTEPISYGLRIAPNYKAGDNTYEFTGQVEILLKANYYTSNITLNAKDIKIWKWELVDYKTQTKMNVDECNMIPEKEWAVIYPTDHLLQGRQYQLNLIFSGLLRPDMTGFYKSTYRVDDVNKWMAVSNFKPTYARRAFPCYDEPGYKTPFNISLGRQSYQITLSNMNIFSTQDLHKDGWFVDHYELTPPIPTYLVGIFVGELKQSEQVEGAELNVYSYNNYLTQGGYAMEETPALLESMENFTESTSDVNKMDYLAVPDFNTDGTENWGINAFRERYVLLDDNAKTKFKEQSSMVIEQQQSHQWFGNLVTCTWWDDLWLNEGFARYFQYFGTDTVKPKWQLEDLFIVEQHQTALEFDQTPRHPVTTTIRNSEDVQNIFDSITRNKAAAILRMIKYTVNENNFRKPLTIFLENYKYGSATTSDLWAVFENYYYENEYKLKSGPYEVPFTDFANSFIRQPGYPVIHVTRKKQKLLISQSKFSIWPSKNENTTIRWYIPLTYTTSQKNNFEVLSPVKWLFPMSSDAYIVDNSNYTWFIFNIQSTGFYRVNYDKSNWDKLISQLNIPNNSIHVRNRAQLIDDSFNLARAGMLDYATALNLSMYLKNEDDRMPWYTAIDCLTYVLERMRRSAEGYEYIKSYVRNLSEIIYKKTEELISLQGLNDHLTLTSWNKFSVWACYLDSEYCTKNAMMDFKRWSENEIISPDIKDAVLCTGIKTNDDQITWNEMLDVYINTNSASEKNSAQSALACTRNTTLLYKYLNFLYDINAGGPVRLQDYKDICAAMSLTPQGIEALTNYLINNIEKILKTIPTGDSIVMYMYWLLASKVALDSEIIKLYNLKNAPGLPFTIKASFDASYLQVEQNVLWYNNYHSSINEWTGAPEEPSTIQPEAESVTSSPFVNESSSDIITEPMTSSDIITEPSSSSDPTNIPKTSNDTVTNVTSINTTFSVTESTPMIKKFDFDNTTPIIISRCPKKSGAQISCLSSAALVMVTAVALIVLSKSNAILL